MIGVCLGEAMDVKGEGCGQWYEIGPNKGVLNLHEEGGALPVEPIFNEGSREVDTVEKFDNSNADEWEDQALMSRWLAESL